MRVVSVVGARPQFVKAAPLSRAIRESGMEEVLVHTGQHHDAEMSQVFFDELDLPLPDHHLGVAGGSHAAMTARMLERLEPVLLAEAPDWIVVYGDTNSTLAAALAAAKLGIPLAHVEAGLRSFNRTMPEELNRVVTDHLSSLLFCPTYAAVDHLRREGITAGVHHVGDVMYDVIVAVRDRISNRPTLEDLELAPGEYALATVHRAENTDDPARLAELFDYLRQREVAVVLPAHPRLRQRLAHEAISTAGVRLIQPLGYLDMMRILSDARELLTDSGGLQKEAYFLGVPCVTLRDETEWVETVDAGWNRLWRTPGYMPRRRIDEYGDGRASLRIAELLVTGP